MLMRTMMCICCLISAVNVWADEETPSFITQAEVRIAESDATATQLESDIIPVNRQECAPLNCDGCATGCNDGCWLFSDTPLLNDYKNQCLFGDFKYSVGGELRHRYMNERNRLRPQGALRPDTYQLWRFTPFLEIGNEWIRGYVQGIDASSFGEELVELPIDVNRWDLLQYYIDVKMLELDGGDLRGQYGRIFLKYGDQHFISPLGWSNTYRNFEGGKLYYQGTNWNVDGFVVRPNNGAASVFAFRPNRFDAADQSILFSGIYATNNQFMNGTLDLFWLWFNEDEPTMLLQDGSRHTLGVRHAGTHSVMDCCSPIRTYHWDALAGWQFGEDDFQSGGADQSVNAGFLSLISGVKFDRLPWTPNVQGVFWWGSGDDDPNDDNINTLYTMYPLGHKYWGLIDNFNGANLINYSLQCSVNPTNKLNLAAHMHWFYKAKSQDFIYNIGGAPLGNTTTANRFIGSELDLLATYNVNKNLQLQAGYFWFWYGGAVDNQAALQRNDAKQFYFMTTWAF